MILINNGAPFTNDANKSVVLTLQNKAAKEMYITNDPSCETGGEWETYKTSRSWVLDKDNGRNSVYAKFRGEVLESSCVNATIVHDSIHPVLNAANPQTYTNKPEIDLSVSASDEGSGVSAITCGNSGAVRDCSQGYSEGSLSEGPHSVSISASDNAGNRTPDQVKSWVVDMTPPTIVFNSAPPQMTSQTTAPFVVTGSDALSPLGAYNCSLDGAAEQVCSTSFSLTVGAGSHTLSITVTDAAGNTSTPATYSWTVDSSKPTVIFTQTPAPKSNVPKPTFAFTGETSSLSSYQCQLDSGAKSACSSPLMVGPLTEGAHTFRVWGTNAVGTVSAPAVYTWLVDLQGPTIDLTQSPGPRVNQTDANFTFTVTDNLAGDITSVCRLDGQPSADCQNSVSYDHLIEGTHRIEIVSKDGAGNLSLPLDFSWIVDLTPPIVSIVSGPPASSAQTSSNFTITASDPNGGTVAQIQCRLDSVASYSTCSPNPSFTDLSAGQHTLYARAVDSAGNISAPVSWQWTVSSTGPVITFTKTPPDPMSIVLPAVVDFNVSDPVFSSDKLTIQCGFNGVLKSCTADASMTLDQQSLGVQSFTVTAKNPAGLTATKTIQWTAKNILQFPSLSNMAAIAFEDNFPAPGDADYNDFVTNFRIVEDINNSNQITKITMDFYPRAVGAGYDHSLIVVLDGTKDTPTNITTTTSPMFSGGAQISLTRFNADGSVASTQGNLSKSSDIVIFSSTHALFGSGTLTGAINSIPSSSYKNARLFARLEIVLTNPASNVVTNNKIDISRFRMILHVKNTNKDIDLVDVDPNNFDANGYPFGFVIPTNWQWPTESSNINNVYPNFPQYRQYLIAKRLNPNATAADPVLNWFDYPVPGTAGIYPLPPTPPLLP